MRLKRRQKMDDRGQALIFAALSMFMLITMIALAVNVARTTTKKIQLQNAADASALAGAQMHASTLSTIAWLNDGMALVYYHMMRHSVDVSVHATLATLKEHGPVFPSDEIVGIEDAVTQYDEVYAAAREFMPKGQRWLRDMSMMQRALALVMPVLVEKKMHEVAAANGAEYTTLFPKSQFFPSPSVYESLDLIDHGNGWSLDSSTGTTVTALVTGEESWDISATVMEQSYSVEIKKIGEDLFRVEYSDENGSQTIIMDRNLYVQTTEDVDITSNPDGSTSYCNGGDCFDIKHQDGVPYINQGDGWVEMPQQESININGAEINVTNQPINLGTNGLANITPERLVVGPIRVTFTDPIRVEAVFGHVWARVEPDYAVANGLRTTNAQCEWIRYQDDHTRHRMCETGSQSWHYEFKRDAAYLAPDNMERFAITHAIGDNDPTFQEDEELPVWASWFSPLTGRSTNGQAYYQTRRCWHPHDLQCPQHGEHEGAPLGYWHDEFGEEVTCPTCDGEDHDGDGFTDVRIHLQDTYARQGLDGLDNLDFQYIDLSAFEEPLVLTDDFFKMGLTVACWAKPDDDYLLSLVYQLDSGFGNQGHADFLKTGIYAVASARAGFYDHDIEEYRYAWEDLEERQEWVDSSYANLYEPRWQARLVPIATLINSEDIDADSVDSGLNYLFRSLTMTHWKRDFFGNNVLQGVHMRDMKSPWNGQDFDVSDLSLQEAMNH